MKYAHDLLLVVALALGASHASAQESPASSPAPKATAAPSAFNKGNLKELATDGARFLDVQSGDLTGTGDIGALVVLDPPLTGAENSSGSARTLLLVDRDAQGRLRTLAQNSKIVPCAKCGGAAGDPYGYARITPGRFSVVTEGGSRQHWWNEYRFIYASGLKTWVVESIGRGVTDTATGRKREINLTSEKLGVIKLQDFDPASLPQIKLN